MVVSSTTPSVNETSSPRGAIVEFRQVSKRFDEAAGPAVLDGINYTIADGQFAAIIGPSGCGKSTLLRIAGDLLAPTSGGVHINGSPAREARIAHDIGFVFQAPNLCPWRSVRRNVELSLETMGVSKRERRERATDQLARVGLESAIDKYPHELSGGMAQRVAIARALVFDPPIVLMDEPFGALDEITRERLNIELHDLWRRTKKTVLFVTHSIPEAVLLATQVVVMGQRPGRIARVIDVQLPEERRSAIESTPAFFEAVKEVRVELHRVMGEEL
jgi:NitT/TauT family transport system ATP-binding protein